MDSTSKLVADFQKAMPLTDITLLINSEDIAHANDAVHKMVSKRNGLTHQLNVGKIRSRLVNLLEGLEQEHIDLDLIIDKTVAYTQNGIKTVELDNLLAETAAYLNILHPDYGKLAARDTLNSFMDVISCLYHYTETTGDNASLIAHDVYEIVCKNHERLQAALNYKRDWDFDYFGFKTLERAYLLKVHGKIVERPQHMLMRVAVGIHKEDIDSVIETYNLMSERWFTHATPTLFNAGTPKPQMSSCFLLTMKDDSIHGIYDTLLNTALISKSAGGVGLAVHCIRATGSYIKGTNGYSNGLVPMLKVFNETARYVDQGGGKRKGSFAIYLEPWHADIFDFLQLKKNHGKEEQRARDLFYALWIPDLFMKRVRDNGDWTLFCPNEAKGLYECHGQAFEDLYTKEGKGRKTIKAHKLWEAIIDSQIETGTPYMLYKDHANSKSNHQHLGTIKSSNLCCEVIEYTSPDEIAVCNLASISLPRFVQEGQFNFELLHQVTRVITKNLNRVIDNNYYPCEEAKRSNLRHRPIGIGVQGLADAFQMMKVTFEEDRAYKLNQEIFETIYHAAMVSSVELAKQDGPYETFKGSPLSLQSQQTIIIIYFLSRVKLLNVIFMHLYNLVSYIIKHIFLSLKKLFQKLKQTINRYYFYFKSYTLTKTIFFNSQIYNDKLGKFQFDLWDEKPPTDRYDWNDLRQQVIQHGARNSLLVAPMPTASTSQILGNNESFEPYTTNLYTRRVLAGEFVCVNPHLIRDLISLGLWNDNIRNQLVADNGSVQKITDIPQPMKDLYKTVWEISQKQLINLSRARAPFICQSQSLNIYMADPSFNKLTSAHFHAWQLGLKTGQYYLRSRPSRDAIKFTLNVESLKKNTDCGLFDHMNQRNKSQAELDQTRRKKRKISEISKSEIGMPQSLHGRDSLDTVKLGSKAGKEFKEPLPIKKTPSVKECPFNPFGNDSCDSCGA